MNLNLRNHINLILGLAALLPTTAFAGEPPLFQHTLTVSIKEPLVLDIAIAKGDINVSYGREGQVTIYSYVKEGDGDYAPKDLVDTTLSIKQEQNHVTIHDANPPRPETESISYRISVPYRTQLTSTISGRGKQTVVGIHGPATVVSGSGDIEGDWIRFGRFKASTGKGKISVERAPDGVDVETSNGSIRLLEVGPIVASVKQGVGSIDIGGAAGTVKASTDKGELHIKAGNLGDWDLKSVSGNIRIEIPPDAKYETDLATNSGVISVSRDEVEEPDDEARQFHYKVKGAGQKIVARSDKGNISFE